MKPEALVRVCAILRGELAAVTPGGVAVTPSVTPGTSTVTPVTPVTPNFDERGNANSQSEAATDRTLPDDDEAAIEERAGLADSIPLPYRDAWSRLNHQEPTSVSEAEWMLALDDGGRFLDAWGSEAAKLRWTPGELFDVRAGLIWRLAGRKVNAIGLDEAYLSDGRIIAKEHCR